MKKEKLKCLQLVNLLIFGIIMILIVSQFDYIYQPTYWPELNDQISQDNGYLEGKELENFLIEFVSSAKIVSNSPSVD